MSRLKCTKIELVRLKKKLILFKKYLPTLQLKKMLLQAEVNKAKEELKKLNEAYLLEKEDVLTHAPLLNDPAIYDVEKAFEVDEMFTRPENIAGIKVRVLERLAFKDPGLSLVKSPLWIDGMIQMIQKLKATYQKVLLGEEKKKILESELRIVSIRVNLFEKRLIPEIVKQINQIRIFLGDQELQAVAQAKVSKEKILKRKLLAEGKIS